MQKGQMARMASTVLLLLLFASVTTLGILKYMGQITNTATIQGYELQLWQTKTGAAVTTIPWGNVEKGMNTTSETALGLTQQLFLKNTGDYLLYAGWNLSSSTPLPNNVTLTAQYYTTSWQDWPQNNYFTLGSLPANTVNGNAIRFTLSIPSDAARGPLSFTIDLLAATTSSG